VVYGNLADLAPDAAPVDVSRAAGYPGEKQILSMYAAAIGSDLDSLHIALAYFKLAVILEGIHYRHAKGQTVGEGFDSVGRVVVPLLESGVDELSKTLGKGVIDFGFDDHTTQLRANLLDFMQCHVYPGEPRRGGHMTRHLRADQSPTTHARRTDGERFVI
jgi:hypothetical protein